MLENYEASNALIIGTAMHMGIEEDVNKAITWYYDQFPIINDECVTETMKLEKVIEMMKKALPTGGFYEVEINDQDFKGFIDYLVPITENEYDLYDFKYSNNFDRYLESDQLHLYKYYFEKNNLGKKIRNLYFVFGPKIQLKQKANESTFEYRKRVLEQLDEKEVTIIQINYEPNMVIRYLSEIKECLEETEYNKRPSKLCYFCEYRPICEERKFYEIKESENMDLPSTERRTITKENYKKIWIYGAPFSGKTTFVDKAPVPVNLNTDGNIKYVTMPVIPIRDKVRVEGRQTIVTKAWEIFKETVGEFSKNQNDFKTLVVDLTEDIYEYCRLYMYDKLNLSHESDDPFRAWDKVRTEFLSTMRRLLNLEYNVILISHEDTTKDIMKKSGDKITAIKPNINEKVANKLAGMVDIVARVVADGDARYLEFKSDEVTFGGGRLNLSKNSIPLDWNELMKIYDSQEGVKSNDDKSNEESPKTDKQEESGVELSTDEVQKTVEPSKRKRKSRIVEELTEEIPEEKPKRRRRGE